MQKRNTKLSFLLLLLGKQFFGKRDLLQEGLEVLREIFPAALRIAVDGAEVASSFEERGEGCDVLLRRQRRRKMERCLLLYYLIIIFAYCSSKLFSL